MAVDHGPSIAAIAATSELYGGGPLMGKNPVCPGRPANFANTKLAQSQ
jgi:hypothetical protein